MSIPGLDAAGMAAGGPGRESVAAGPAEAPVEKR